MRRLFFFLLLFCITALSTGPAAAQPVELVDMLGHRVVLPAQVDRIVTTFKPATLTALSLGLGDRLVGLDGNSRYDPLQIKIYPLLQDLPSVGSKSTGLNFESLLAVDPDLVILYSQKDGKELASRLESHGIPCLFVLPETFAGIEESLHLIAQAVGEPERATRVISAMRHATDLAAKYTSDIPEAQRKTVYFSSPKSFLSTAGGDMLQDSIIRKAGGINCAQALSGYFRQISPEQLLLWNPDMLCIAGHARRGACSMLSRSSFSQLDALKTGATYCFPSSLAPWDFPSPLSALGSLWMAKRLYPERMKDVDLLHEIDRFHTQVFGKSFREMDGELEDMTPYSAPVTEQSI